MCSHVFASAVGPMLCFNHRVDLPPKACDHVLHQPADECFALVLHVRVEGRCHDLLNRFLCGHLRGRSLGRHVDVGLRLVAIGARDGLLCCTRVTTSVRSAPAW